MFALKMQMSRLVPPLHASLSVQDAVQDTSLSPSILSTAGLLNKCYSYIDLIIVLFSTYIVNMLFTAYCKYVSMMYTTSNMCYAS